MTDRRCKGVGLVVLLATLVTGCAGATVEVTARRALYPISMSGTVRDSGGMLLDTRSLQIVSGFHVEETRMGIGYGFTPRSTVDISDEVNAQVSAARGQAIVALRITVDRSCNVLNSLPIFNMIPIWPGCVPVVLDGLVVRRVPAQPY